MDIGFQCSPPPFLLVSGHCMPISHSHCLKILCSLITHILNVLPLFHISSILAVTVCFGILWLCFLSIYSYYLNLGDFINFTVSTPCNISCTSLLVLFLAFFFLYWTINFSYSLPFECSKSIYFFWCHFSDF